MGREPCYSREDLNRGAWTAEEDSILKAYIQEHGEGRWRSLPKRAGLKRCGKSCRLRWLNYLRPGIKRGNISEQEDDLIIRLHRLLGNKWSLIAGRLPGRTDNEIKNYWNTNLKKRLQSRSSSQQFKCNKHEEKLKVGAVATARPAHEEERAEADGGQGPAVETPQEILSSAMEKRKTQLTHDDISLQDPQMESIWDLLLQGDARHGSTFSNDAVDENSLLHCDGEHQLWDDLARILMETEGSTVMASSPVDHLSGGGHLKDWTSLFEPVQENGTLDVELYDSSLFSR